MGSKTPRAKPQSPLGDIVPKDHRLKIEPAESKSELESRLRQREAEAWHARLRDTVVLFAVVTVVAAVACQCMWIVVHPKDHDAETIKWATTTLTAIISAGVGYAVRGKTSKPE
jgi:hypothetical protein